MDFLGTHMANLVLSLKLGVTMSCLRDLPYTYSCTCIFFLEKTKTETTRALPVKKLGSLNLIIIIIFFYLFNFFYFMCSPNFLSFSINKAKVKFTKINIALIYLYYNGPIKIVLGPPRKKSPAESLQPLCT